MFSYLAVLLSGVGFGHMVSSVNDVLGESRVQDLMDKLDNLLGKSKASKDTLPLSVFKNKPGDAYLDLKRVPEQFLEEAGSIGMLTTLGYSWMYTSLRSWKSQGGASESSLSICAGGARVKGP